MSDFVMTGIAMAAAVAAYKIWDGIKAARKARLKAQAEMRRQKRSAEPRDLGRLTRAEDGTYVPEKRPSS